MNYKLLLNFSLLTGEIMLENGAETSRVEDTISRIILTSGCQTAEAFATPTGIFVSLDHTDTDLLTVVRRVKRRRINLNRIALANNVSRDFCSGIIPLESAMYQMQQIKEEPEYKPAIRILSIGFVSAFFSLMLGGTLSDFIVCLITTLIFGLLERTLSRLDLSKFFIDLLGGILGSLIPYIFFYKFNYGAHFDVMVISSIMPMVPGVAITNAIRDTLHGDLLSGLARGMDAFIIAASIATGVGVTLSMLL